MKTVHSPLSTLALIALVAVATNKLNAQTWDTCLPLPNTDDVGWAVLIDPLSTNPSNPSLFIGTQSGLILRMDPASSTDYNTTVVDSDLQQVTRIRLNPVNRALYAVGDAVQAISKRTSRTVWRVRTSSYDLNRGGTWTDQGGDTFALSSSESSRARGCTVDPQGNVFVSGTATLNGTPHWIVRVLPVGSTTWQTFSDLTSPTSATAGGMCYFPGYTDGIRALDPAVFVVGMLGDVGVVQRLGQDGSRQIVDSWPMTSGANDISYDLDGNLYAVGYNGTSLALGWVVRKSADGGNTWTPELDVPPEGYYSGAGGVACDSQGSVWVCGFTDSRPDLPLSAVWTIVQNSPLDSSWLQSWGYRQYLFTGSSLSRPYAIAADDYGNVFVTGFMTVPVSTKGSKTTTSNRVVVQRLAR